MKIYLITHPDTVVSSKIPPSKWKISRDGWRQVRNLGRKDFWKEVSFIFASREPKANLAAKHWSKKRNIPMKIVDGIEEMNPRRFLRRSVLIKNDVLFYKELHMVGIFFGKEV